MPGMEHSVHGTPVQINVRHAVAVSSPGQLHGIILDGQGPEELDYLISVRIPKSIPLGISVSYPTFS